MFLTVDTRLIAADYKVLDNAGLCLVQKQSTVCRDLFTCFFKAEQRFTPVLTIKSGIASALLNWDSSLALSKWFTDISITVTAELLKAESGISETVVRAQFEQRTCNWRSAAGRDTYRRSAVYRL